MKKALKILAWVVGVPLVLLVAVIIIVPLVFDPNEHKPQLTALVKDATGRDFKIDGDIKLSLFPWVGVSTGAVELGNAPGFGPEPFARLDKADVRVAIVPLLSKRVEVATLTVHGAAVHLARDKQGKSNWDDLTASAAAATPAEQAPPPRDTPTGPAAMAASFALGGIDIRDATLTWHDAAAGTSQRIEGLQLTTGAVKLGPQLTLEPVPIKLSFAAKSTQPAATGKVMLETLAAPDLINGRHRLDNTKLNVTFDAPGFGVSGNLTLAAQLLADLPKDTLDIKGLHLQLQADNKSPAVSAHADLSSEVNLGITSQKVRVAPFALQLTAKGDPVPGGEAKANLHAEINADLKQQTLEIAQLTLAALGINLDGALKGSKIIDAPAFDGHLNVAPFNPREVIAALKQPLPEMADASALTKLDANLDFSATPTTANIKNLLVHLDQSTLNASSSIKNFAKPAIVFDVRLDGIDADRYLPPKKPDAETPAEQTPPPTAAPQAATPLEPLRQLDAQGKLAVGNIKINNLKASDIHATLSAKDGLIQLHPLGAQLYSGVYTGNVQLDARGDVLKVAIDEQLKGIQAGPLLKDLMGDDKLSGAGTFTIKATVAGTEPKAIMSSLNGLATLAFRDGAVKGINIGKFARQAQALGDFQVPGAVEEEEKTDFAALDATLHFEQGKVKNDDLDVKAPVARITGKGFVDLPANGIDYLVTAAIASTTKGQGGREVSDLRAVSIPIRVHGKLDAPKFDLDKAGFLDALTKGQLKAKEAQLKQQLDQQQSKLKEEAQRKADELQAQQKERLKKEQEKAKETLKGLFQ
jgi:AsmA protein